MIDIRRVGIRVGRRRSCACVYYIYIRVFEIMEVGLFAVTASSGSGVVVGRT
jgi:hypothetical protein